MMSSWAVISNPADFRVVCKDGTVACFRGSGTSITFSEDASLLYITTKYVGDREEAVVCYAVDGIEAIEFSEDYFSEGQYSYGGSHVDVAVDPSDETSYTEVSEKIVTNETHDDFGDFVENCPVSGNVSVTYNGTSVTVKGASGTVTTGGKPGNVLSGVMVKVTGAHVEVSSTNKDVAFALSGSTEDGSFKLMGSSKRSHIVLSGVSITNPKGAAINIQSSKTMLVKLTDGTSNYLEDGTTYTMVGEEDQKGTFFSEGQLVFSDKGALEVKSNYGHGIACDDYVRVRSGNITVNSTRDGINTNDRFVMYGGSVTVNAGQDGLDVGKGYIEIGAGKLTVDAVDEGITASYEGEDDGTIDATITPYIDIKGGLVKVTTTGDKGHGLRAMSTLSMSGGIVQATVKGAGSKALMSEGNMSLTGGKVTAFTEGDALYEEGDLSSSACVRSKGTLCVENMTLGVKSTGTGGKGINNVGDVLIKNSRVAVVASGETHRHDDLDSRSRGVTTDGSLTLNGGSLLVKSYDEPLHVKGTQSFLNEAVYNSYQIGE